MKVVVTATDGQWAELTGTPCDINWLRVDDASEFASLDNATAFINLEEPMIKPFYAALNRPVLINSVTHTLSEMEAPENVLRINGWVGFLQRPEWEIAGRNAGAMEPLFGSMNKKINPVADEPGFIAARIIAMIINEAYFALGQGVSGKAEIDTAMKLGTNYPYGPFEWAANIGRKNILGLLQQLNLTDKRYQPAPLLLEEAMEEKS